MKLNEYIDQRKTDRNLFYRTEAGLIENLLDEAIAEITRLRCDGIQCDQGRDVLASLYEAMDRLPTCGTLAIVGAAAQEIAALRGIVADWLGHSGGHPSVPNGQEWLTGLKNRSRMAIQNTKQGE